MYKNTKDKNSLFKSAVRMTLNSPEWQSIARICWGKERFDEWLKNYEEEKRKERQNYESVLSNDSSRNT